MKKVLVILREGTKCSLNNVNFVLDEDVLIRINKSDIKHIEEDIKSGIIIE